MDNVVALLIYIGVATSSPTAPYPTINEPSNDECSLTQHLDYTDYIIDAQKTASFLNEDENLFWIKLYEPDKIIQERQLFSINTSYNFDAMYNYILLTTNIYGNFNNNSNYYITQINPKFFISDNNNYIGISFDDGIISFTGTSCNGTSSLPNSTNSILYINGYNHNATTSFGGSHIKIMIQLNRTDSNTLVVVQWTDTTETQHYQSICQYNTLFNDTSNIIFTTASAINDDYYRFSHIDFKFCANASNVNISQTISPTPAPTDFIYVGCPAYNLKLSDFIKLDEIISNSQVNYFSTANHNYAYSFVNTPTKTSEWLLSSSTYVKNIISSATDTSLKIRVNIAPNIGCKNEIITLQDTNKFLSIYFTRETIGFYPPCDTSLSDLPPYPFSIYHIYPDPASNIAYDTNNIIWEQSLDININPEIIFIFAMLANKTTATITSKLNETNATVNFKCTWNGLFTPNDTFEVLLASATDQPCGIKDIEVEYCALKWDYPLDFCENITNASQLQLWSDTNTHSIEQEIVHGEFNYNKTSINVIYNNVPQHELVDITTTFYVPSNSLTTYDIIQFQITLGTNTKTLATYIGNTDACAPPWNQTQSLLFCAFKTNKINFKHTANSLNIIVSYHKINIWNISSFNWAFDSLCIDQSFKNTNAPTNSPSNAPTNAPTIPTISPTNAPTIPPTPRPTNMPTLPTLSPTQAPTQPPTFSPTAAPTHPTNAPTNAPTQPPTFSPTKAPTTPPTNTPTNPPTIAPTNAPTTPPSNAPTQPPTNTPSNSPTTPPTNSPTKSPTTPPTISPTHVSMSPTNAPTNTPTISPTHSPTRYPITSREYDSFFLIKYLIKYLENEYIEILVNDIIHITNDIIEIIEQSYLELTGLKYYFFCLKFKNILGYKITQINQDKYAQFKRSQDNIYINSKIECDKISCRVLSLKHDIIYEFESMVTTKLRNYFADYTKNNISSQLIFEIESFGEIQVLYPENISLSALMNENKLLSALVIMMIISVFISFLAFLHNKQMFCILPGGSLMDSTIWFAFIIYVLHIANFLSNIKLCVEIINLSLDDQFTDLRINICAISCIVFLIIPYAINVYFTKQLTTYIATLAIGNINAILFFEESKCLMTMLFLMCGDLYTVIYLLSSSIFGLQILNSGLSKYELKKMSKMKIISTIIFLNIPQICIQCVVAAIIHKISANIAFAFITSVLSIIVTPINYRNVNISYFTYYIEIKNNENSNNSDVDNENENQIDKYLLHKGKTQQMSKIFCRVLGYDTPEDDIEISRNSIVNASNNGIILYVTHKISTEKTVEIIKLYQEKQQLLQGKFRQHFNLNESCILLFKIVNQQNGNVIPDNNSFQQVVKKSMDKKGLKTANYLYGNGITGKDGGEQQKYTTENTVELEAVKQNNIEEEVMVDKSISIQYDNDRQSESSDFSFPV